MNFSNRSRTVLTCVLEIMHRILRVFCNHVSGLVLKTVYDIVFSVYSKMMRNNVNFSRKKTAWRGLTIEANE